MEADALNSLARYGREGLRALLKSKKCDVIFTPHVKEFSRLFGWEMEEVFEKGLSAAKEVSSQYGVNVLLKSAVSVLSDGARVCVNTAGCSGQAKAGSGDVLSGVIAGLCAMGLSTFDGGMLGAYLVGKSAELASEKVGEYSLTASELVAYMGGAFSSLTVD